jgi:putative endonuclease
VKTRTGGAFGTPAEAVDAAKQEKIRAAARAFTTRYRSQDYPVRFDILAIDASGRELKIDHLRGAF